MVWTFPAPKQRRGPALRACRAGGLSALKRQVSRHAGKAAVGIGRDEYRRALAGLSVAPDLIGPFRPGVFAPLISAVLVSRRNCETVPQTPLPAGRPGAGRGASEASGC